MSFNGSGTFILNVGGYPYVNGTTIVSANVNALLQDIANGLSLTVTRDGQMVMTGPLHMGNQLIDNILSLRFGNAAAIPGGVTGLFQGTTNVLSLVTNGGTGLQVAANQVVTIPSGLIVTAGGVTVSAGGATITGNSTVTGTLTSSSTLTVSAGGGSVAGVFTFGDATPNLVQTNPVSFRAHLSTTQSSGVLSPIIYDTVDFQKGGTNYSNTTGLFTAPVTGVYLLTVSTVLGTTAGGAVQGAGISAASVQVCEGSASGVTSVQMCVSASAVVSMAASQTASCSSYNTTSRSIIGDVRTSFSGCLLARTA